MPGAKTLYGLASAFLLLLSLVSAQSSAELSSSSRLSSTISSPANSSGTNSLPTRTIFLPISSLGNPQASIVTANAESTVYGLACLHSPLSGCTFSPSVTITEGAGTLIYTQTFGAGDGSSSTTRGPVVINCTMSGSGSDASVTQAVCAGATSISGLGSVASSSTLAGDQISYATVTITAGAEILSSAATASPSATGGAGGSSSTSSGIAAGVTGAGSWVAGAAAVIGMAALGGL